MTLKRDTVHLSCVFALDISWYTVTIRDSSSECSCDLSAVVPLLAAVGPVCVEPLLWLYRSRGMHFEVLAFTLCTTLHHLPI